MTSRSFALGAGLFVALVLLLSFTLVACDDSPPPSRGVEIDIDHPKKSKARPAAPAPRKTVTTTKRVR